MGGIPSNKERTGKGAMIFSLIGCRYTFNPAPGRHRSVLLSPLLPLARFSLRLLRAVGCGAMHWNPGEGTHSHQPVVSCNERGEGRTDHWPAGRCTLLEDRGAHLCPTQADPWWPHPQHWEECKSLICPGLKEVLAPGSVNGSMLE